MNEKRKPLMISILVIMIIALGGIVLYYWYNSAYYISTEDARVAGDLYKVSPEVSGKLVEFDVNEGDTVIKGQILGRQEIKSLADSSLDQSIIRTPISGVVIKKQSNPGEYVTSGQTLAYVIDPANLYITANIEETKLARIKTGQQVDIAIDQFEKNQFTGKVKSIGLASNSTFSLLSTSTSGTFTKVVQRIPVKIEFDHTGSNILPGTNAVIKIHVK